MLSIPKRKAQIFVSASIRFIVEAARIIIRNTFVLQRLKLIIIKEYYFCNVYQR